MSKINDGGPAFPIGTTSVDNNGQPLRPYEMEPLSGMSLRDWFAGQMLCGLGAAFANMVADDGATAAAMTPAAKGMAVVAYEFADAMLAERAKGGA